MYASSGVSGAGLKTTVQPVSSGRASLTTALSSGAFHGAIPATTPTGSRTTSASASAPGRCSSNAILRATSTNVGMTPSARAVNTFDSVSGRPISAVTSSGDLVGARSSAS